jgi:hypothetical protein
MFIFYLFSPAPPPTVLSFFLSLNIEKDWKIRVGWTHLSFQTRPSR